MLEAPFTLALGVIGGIYNQIKSWIGDITGFLGSHLSGAGSVPPQLAGHRALGGGVGPGSWLVGEHGPEILTMGGSGYVTPNGALGGGVQITNHYAFTLSGLPQQIVGQIQAAIAEHDRQLVQQLQSA